MRGRHTEEQAGNSILYFPPGHSGPVFPPFLAFYSTQWCSGCGLLVHREGSQLSVRDRYFLFVPQTLLGVIVEHDIKFYDLHAVERNPDRLT